MLFDFQCTFCEDIFEDLVGSNDPNPECKICGADTVKLIGKPQNYTGAKTQFVDGWCDRVGHPELKD